MGGFPKDVVALVHLLIYVCQRYCKHLCLGKPKWLGLGMDYNVENEIRKIGNRLKISKQSGFPCQSTSLLLQPWSWQFFFFWSKKLPVAPPYWSFSFIWTNQQWHIGRAYWLMMYSNVIGNIACAGFFFQPWQCQVLSIPTKRCISMCATHFLQIAMRKMQCVQIAICDVKFSVCIWLHHLSSNYIHKHLLCTQQAVRWETYLKS